MIDNTMVFYYPDDWVVVNSRGTIGPLMESTDRGATCEVSVSGVLCPRSLYEGRFNDFFDGRKRFTDFLRTGEIPKDCPELKRICSLRNIGTEP